MKFTSPVFSAVSGSIAGIVYSHNAGGMYTRARAVPTDPSSARQQVMRMYLDQAVTYWTETLLEVERESWRLYAANVPVIDRLGQTINLSGQNMFVRSGVPWLLGGQALADIATAPAIFDTGDPGSLTLVAVTAPTGAVEISIDGAPAWAAQDAGRLLVQAGLPQNPSINFYKGPFRFIGSEDGDSVTPITASTTFLPNANPPIAVAEGQRLFVRARAQYDDGRLTQAFVFDVLATPM